MHAAHGYEGIDIVPAKTIAPVTGSSAADRRTKRGARRKTNPGQVPAMAKRQASSDDLSSASPIAYRPAARVVPRDRRQAGKATLAGYAHGR